MTVAELLEVRKAKSEYKPQTYSRSRKTWIVERKQGESCTVCGDSQKVLHYHHRYPSTKLFSIRDYPLRPELTLPEVLAEIEKCDLVCGDCHRKIHS